MIINWKKPKAGLKVIPLLTKDNRITGYVRLLPGHNVVKDDTWEQIERNNKIKDDIAKGYLVKVLTKKEIKKATKDGKEKIEIEEKPASDLNDLEAKNAREIVEDTWDMEVLKGWLEIEGRNEIRAVISNQIDKIENAGATK